jgi:hypothetical protein
VTGVRGRALWRVRPGPAATTSFARNQHVGRNAARSLFGSSDKFAHAARTHVRQVLATFPIRSSGTACFPKGKRVPGRSNLQAWTVWNVLCLNPYRGMPLPREWSACPWGPVPRHPQACVDQAVGRCGGVPRSTGRMLLTAGGADGQQDAQSAASPRKCQLSSAAGLRRALTTHGTLIDRGGELDLGCDD